MRRLLGLTLLVLGAAAAAARAESRLYEVTVAAGGHDRANVPVRVPVDEAPGKNRVVVRDAAGKELPCQLTGPSLLSTSGKSEVHFLLPDLKKGTSATFKVRLTAGSPGAASGFAWHDAPGDHADLRYNDRPVLRYVYKALDDSTPAAREQTYKVYHHLFDPDGNRVTKGPGGLFTHHRGLFYAFNRVTYGDTKRVDIWHCTGDTHQAHAKILRAEAGPVLGRHVVAVHWNGVKKETFAVEHRELTAYHVPGGQLVEFGSVLKSQGEKIRLDGDPQHAGFHFRADNEVADKTKGQTVYVRPDGAGKPGETRNWDPKTRKGPVNLPWNAMSFVLGDRRYTAAYLDHPGNPKEARGSERDYGRFGSYFEYDLDPTKDLRVNYRVWLQKGLMTPDEVAGHSANFVTPVTVAVK